MERFAGEPTLDEIFSDPIIRSVMKADHVDPGGLRAGLLKAAHAAARRRHRVRTQRRKG